MTRSLVVAIAITLGAGCSDDGATIDARPDAPIDAAPDAFVTVCTGPQEFTGELIDFDSNPALFLGVVDAVFTLRGEPRCSTHTAPNGRFILHIPATDQIADVDAPDPYLDGEVIVPRATITAPGIEFSQRAVSLSRAQELDPAQDTAHGLVGVYQAGSDDTWTLTNSNASVGTEDGTTWAASTSAKYLLFTNVDPGTQTLTPAGGTTIGGGDIPVVAGQVTWVTTLAP